MSANKDQATISLDHESKRYIEFIFTLVRKKRYFLGYSKKNRTYFSKSKIFQVMVDYCIANPDEAGHIFKIPNYKEVFDEYQKTRQKELNQQNRKKQP